MYKLIFVVLFVAVIGQQLQIASANPFIRDTLELHDNNTFPVYTVNDINAFRTQHPEIELEELHVISNVKQQLVYHLGARMPGDRLVAHGVKKQSWVTPQNVGITLTYPTSGTGALVTYVYIVVNQSTTSGRAYIAKGGIHQRFITIIIEAYSVTFMNIDANIFGMV